jgi:hypothetical protein
MDDMVLTGAVSSYAFHQLIQMSLYKPASFAVITLFRLKFWHLDKLRLPGGNADSHLGGNAKISFPDPKKEKLRPEFSVWPYGLCNFSTIFENGWWLKTCVLFCEFWQLLQAKAQRLWGKSAFEIWWEVHSKGFSNIERRGPLNWLNISSGVSIKHPLKMGEVPLTLTDANFCKLLKAPWLPSVYSPMADQITLTNGFWRGSHF